MSAITKKLSLFTIIIFSFASSSFGQYRALEISIYSDSYIDDHEELEFEFRMGSLPALRQIRIGYTFLASSKILLTPKIGLAWAKEQYFNENSIFFVPADRYYLERTKNLKLAKIGIESTYWFESDFKDFFFSFELNASFNLSANSITKVYESSGLGYSGTYNKEEDFSQELQTMVPSLRVGVGYNLNLFSFLNIFAIAHLGYRPRGYYRETQNIRHLNKTISFGMKYVIKGGTSILQKWGRIN